MADFRTEKEKQRDAEHDRIAARYTEYRANYPAVSDNKLFTQIAREVSRTTCNVRQICIKAGVVLSKTESV